MENDALLNWIDADIASSKCAVKEFPVTSMTRALWRGIRDVNPLLDNPKAALDVGSGSGVHSFLLSSLGIQNVQGLERSKQAIEYAVKRDERLRDVFSEAVNWVRPQFIQGSIETIMSNSDVLGQYDIMTMNPPAFYYSDAIRTDIPLDSGLYTGPAPTPENPETENPIDDFFRVAVTHMLSRGGIVICTWPAIQTRQVRYDTHVDLHPAQILARRLKWQIEGAENKSFEDFYCLRGQLAYNGAAGNGDFRQNIHRYLNADDYHCSIRRSDPGKNFLPTFAFGVLALRRDTNDLDRFHLIDIETPK